jgi:translocation and assembly module TamB
VRPIASRILRWLLATAALVLLAAIGAGAWLLTTEAGLARAIALLGSLERVEIRVQGARGRLIGPLAADSIEIAHPRATIRIDGFEADYEPSELLAGRIAAETVRAGRVAVRVHERTEPPGPPGFLPGWLTLAIDDAAIARLDIVSPGGAELLLEDVGASVTVTRAQVAFRDARAHAGGWAIAGAGGRLHAREPLGLDVHAAWSLFDGPLITGIAHANGDLGRLAVDARAAAPGTGRARLELLDLAGDLRWHGQAWIERLDLSQWIEAAPVGPLDAALTVAGDRANYFAEGLIQGAGLPAGGMEVGAAVNYADGLITVPRLALTAADGAMLTLDGTISLGGDPRLAASARWSRLRWPLAGAEIVRLPRGNLRVAGWGDLDWRLDGEFGADGVPPVAGAAAGRLTASQLVVDESAWQTLGGTVAATGMLSRGTDRAWTIAGSASGLEPGRLRPGLPGRLAFDFAASGNGLDRDARWAAAIGRLSGQLRGQPASGAGIVRRQAGRLQFERVALALGPARLRLDGHWSNEPDLSARLAADDLSAFVPGLAGEIDAALDWQGGVVALGFTGHGLAWGDHRAAIFSADARVDLQDRDTSWLRLRTSGLSVAGFELADTRLSLDGLWRDHAMEFRVGTADDAVELQGRGAAIDGAYSLQLQRLVAGGPRLQPWSLEAPARLAATKDGAELAPFCLALEQRRACVEGRWRRGEGWSLQARAQAIPLHAQDPGLAGGASFRGLLFADVSASGRDGAPWLASGRAEVRESLVEFQSVGGSAHSVALGRGVLAFESRADRHRLDFRMLDADGIDLAAEVAAERVVGLPFGELPLSGRVRGTTRQLGLLPLVLRDIDRASGELALDIAIGGRALAPSLTGQARLAGAELDFYPTNLRLRGLRATLTLRDESVGLSAAASAGDGSLELDGALGWRDRRLHGELALRGERLLLADVPEARVLASPDLRFVLDDRRIEVSGSVEIPQARIAPAATAGAVLPSPDERIVRPEDGDGGGEPFDVTSDLRLLLGDRVEINAYGLRGRISGSVRARSAPREAVVAAGEFQIEDGKYRAYTRELDVERGRLLFTGGPVTDPGVDLRASRKVPGYTVGVIARGRLRRPQLTLFSEPGLPQTEIASLLIVGRSLDSLQADDRSRLGSEDSGLATQGGALLAGQLGRYVGLDEVGLAEDADNGSALVIGKFLSPRLYVSYGISLVDEINTLKLRYTIGDRWVFAAESGREAAVDIEYRIER